MAITVPYSKTNVSASNTNNPSVTLVRGDLANNDLLVAFVSINSGTATLTAPDGTWNALTLQAGNSRRCNIFWKRISNASTESLTPTWTINTNTAWVISCLGVRGCTTSAPVIAETGGSFSSTGTISGSTTWSNDGSGEIALLCGTINNNTATLAPTDPATEYTELKAHASVGHSVIGQLFGHTSSLTDGGIITASGTPSGVWNMVVLQGDGASTRYLTSVTSDAYIRQDTATTNYGSGADIRVGFSGATATTSHAGLWDLPISTMGIPARATITSATWYLWCTTKFGSPTNVAFFRLKTENLTGGTFNEVQATYNIYKTGSNWPGGAGALGDADLSSTPALLASHTPSGSATRGAIDVTCFVTDAIDRRSNTMLLYCIGQSIASAYYDFMSKEGVTLTNLIKRPLLVVEYSQPSAHRLVRGIGR